MASGERTELTAPLSPQIILSSEIRYRSITIDLERDFDESTAISHPTPTRAYGNEPAYAFFAYPSLDMIQTRHLHPPTHWWLVSATNGKLLRYNPCDVMHFAPDNHWQQVIEPVRPQRPAIDKAISSDFRNLLNTNAHAFFLDTPIDRRLKTGLAFFYTKLVKAGVSDWYQALTPDFWDWLHQT